MTRIQELAEQVAAAFPFQQYATFLTNHDQQRTLSRLGGSLGENRVAAAALLKLGGLAVEPRYTELARKTLTPMQAMMALVADAASPVAIVGGAAAPTAEGEGGAKNGRQTDRVEGGNPLFDRADGCRQQHRQPPSVAGMQPGRQPLAPLRPLLGALPKTFRIRHPWLSHCAVCVETAA